MRRRTFLVAIGLFGFSRAARSAETAPSSTRWTDSRVAGQFHCQADFSLAGHDRLFKDLAQIQADLIYTLGIKDSAEPVELYLFGDKGGYRSYLKARYPQVPYRRALFVKGRGPGKVYAYRSDELDVDVRHEGTHGLLHASLPMVPLWLDEGLAEFFEAPPDDRAYGNPHLSELKWNLRLGMAPRLRPLEQKRDLGEMSAVDYRYAWAWVHFMLYGPKEAHEELVDFIADIGAGTPPGRLSERLERRLPNSEKRLVEHFKAWKR